MKRNTNQMGRKDQGKGLAECIASVILKAQEQWARGMQRLTSGLSTRALKVYVINIAVLATSYSAFIVYSALWQSGNVFPKIESIQKPPISVSKAAYKNHRDTLLLVRIKSFHQYMDSLRATRDGHRIVDSILKSRPGLLDSIRRVETIYGSK